MNCRSVRDRAFLKSTGVAGKVLGGWVLTGIHQYSAGVPIVLTANNTLPLFNQLLRPDVVQAPAASTSVSNFDPNRDLWINKDAFGCPRHRLSVPARAATRICARRIYLNENFGLLKHVKLHERLNVTFRAELFNAFNRTVFAAPQANVSNAQFGRISGAGEYAQAGSTRAPSGLLGSGRVRDVLSRSDRPLLDRL